MEARNRVAQDASVDGFLRMFDDCAVAPTRRLISVYVRGQLGPLPRKSVMPMALAAGVPPRTLQELLSLHRWDEARMRDLLQRRLADAGRKGPVHARIVEAVYPKKGMRTPGVARQLRTDGERAENCVVILHLVAGEGRSTVLADSRLYLPREWAEDPERRRRASVPESLPYRSKAALAVEMVDRARLNGLEFDTLVWNASVAGKVPPEELTRRAKTSVLEVSSRFLGSSPDDPDGVPCSAEIRALRESFLAVAVGGERWMVADFRFAAASAAERGTWRMAAGRPLPSGGMRYVLADPAAPLSTSALLAAVRRGDALERSFAGIRQDIGLDHFEVRTYRSLERHFILSSATSVHRATSIEADPFVGSPDAGEEVAH